MLNKLKIPKSDHFAFLMSPLEMHARTETDSQYSDSGSTYKSDTANMNDADNWKKITEKNGILEYSIYVHQYRNHPRTNAHIIL